jgi:hypothetical protein
MITTLTILSLHQGRIYPPPPEPVQEQTAAESAVVASAAAEARVTHHYLRWLNVKTGLQAVSRLFAPAFGSGPASKMH